MMRTKEFALVKLLWRNQYIEEATWEVEEDVKAKCPYLFVPSNDEIEGKIPYPYP